MEERKGECEGRVSYLLISLARIRRASRVNFIHSTRPVLVLSDDENGWTDGWIGELVTAGLMECLCYLYSEVNTC